MIRVSPRSLVVPMIACVVAGAQAQTAVQWRVEDGGNGHWYSADPVPRTWAGAQANAVALGGHLATATSASENVFVVAVRGLYGVDRPWLGGYQDLGAPDYSEPAGGWRWVTGETWQWTSWASIEPNNQGSEHWLHYGDNGGLWNDLPSSSQWPSLLEWSADCNSDGIVDFGQIVDGTLPDQDADNVPDCCQSETPCSCPADLSGDGSVGPVDLAIVLEAWGATDAKRLAHGDADGSGAVDGGDLSLILFAWGTCP